MTLAYAIAVAGGLVPVFISPRYLWVVPLVAMIAYLLWGYRRAVSHGLIFEFADAFYYLGFTLSVGSLLAALEPFDFAKRPDTVAVFHHFGLGMLSTLLGVVGRTLLQTYHRLPEESIEATNQEIQEEAARYLAGLQKLSVLVQTNLAAVSTHYATVVEPSLARVDTALRKGERIAAAAQDRAVAATDRMAGTLERLDALVSTCEGTAKRLVTSHDGVAQASTGLGSAITGAARRIEEARVGAALSDLSGDVTACRHALQKLQEQMQGIDLLPISSLANEELATLATSLKGVNTAAKRIKVHAETLASPELEKAAASLGEALTAAARSWSEEVEQRQKLAASVQQSATEARTTAEETTRAARELQSALYEVVNVATYELATRLGGGSAPGPMEALPPFAGERDVSVNVLGASPFASKSDREGPEPTGEQR